MNNLVFSIFFIVIIAITSSIFTVNNTNTTFYKCIKPDITPPNFVFPLVWNTLYLLLIFSLYLSLQNESNIVKTLLIINLLLNIVWCYVYFEKRDIKSAFTIIMLMVVTLIICIYNVKSNIIKLLLLPYLVWLSFASLLNYKSIEKIKDCI